MSQLLPEVTEEKFTPKTKHTPDSNGHPPEPETLEDGLIAKWGEPFPEGGKTLNPQYFVARFRSKHLLIYEASEEAFYLYNKGNGLWEHTDDEQMKVLVADEIMLLAEETNKAWLYNKTNDHNLSNFVRLLRGRSEKRDAFMLTQDFVHCLNGVLVPSSDGWELTEFDPDYYSRNQIPFIFDQGAKCDRFKSELLDTALDEDDINLLQVLFGSVLLGGNKAQVMFILTGTSGGGKTTLMKILEGVIGKANVTQLRTQFLGERFETNRYVGKRLLAARDVDADFLEQRHVGVLKALVGGDDLTTESKGSNKVAEIEGHYAVSIVSNSKLRVNLDGDDDAWERRILILNYDKPKVGKPIDDFDKVLLRDEGSGILNWMLVGASEFLRQMETNGKLTLTKQQRDRVTSLLCESNSVRNFIKERVTRTKGCNVTSAELLAAYGDYCDEKDWAIAPTQKAEREFTHHMLDLHRSLKRNDIKRGGGKPQRGFGNVELLTYEDAYE